MQQIINFLLTENEPLCNILTFFMAFIEMLSLLYLVKAIFNPEIKFKKLITVSLLMTIVTSICRLLLPLPLNSLFNFILLLPIMALCIKISFFESGVVIIIFMILTALLEYVINLFITRMFSTNIYDSTTIPMFKIIFSFSLCAFCFLFIYFFKFFKGELNLSNQINKKEKFNIFILLFATLLLVCPNLVFLIFVNMKIPTFYIVYNFISAIIFFFLGTYSTYKLNRLQVTQRELETANLYNNTLSKLVDSNRGFRHDINNIINAIGGYIELNDMNGLKKYYNIGLLPEIKKSNNLSLLNPDVINSPPLFGLFLAKYNYADTLGVKVELNSFFNYSTINMNIFDFVKIFGILFDNAIEAASKCPEKLVSIYVTIDFYNRKQVFKIMNTYIDKNININKIFEKDYSTKEIKSGFGLWEVKQLLKKYPKVKLLSSKDDKFFSQKLEIYF